MLTESKIVINKPVKEVWNFFKNPDNLKLWLGGFQKFEHVSGTPGTVGAKAKHHFVAGGKELTFDGELTEVIREKRIIGILDSSMMLNKVTNSFNDLGSGQTEVGISSDMQFKGFPWKQIGPLMKGEFKKRQEKDLQTLKQLLENGKEDP
ncbi:MAG TPA: SRPBCC family protein [Chitinophagaceae bacterium]|nr:SRPBCC family protein [Chitinophagaceae bacterium]